MHHLIPVVRLVEHLGDKGLLTESETLDLQAKARQLTFDGFSVEVITEVLFNWSSADVRAEIERYQESPEEHLNLHSCTLNRDELRSALLGQLNGERPEIESLLDSIHDGTRLSIIQAITLIPRHHPKAIDAVVDIYLRRTRQAKSAPNQ